VLDSRSRRRNALRAALGALVLLALPAFAASPLASRGQPLVEVIAALEARGLTIIYSSELLDANMTVRDEPHASDPLEILREVLKPWGLAVSPGPHDAWLVVREAPATGAPVASAPAPATSAKPRPEAPPLETIVVSASFYSLGRESAGSTSFLSHAQLESLPTLGEDVVRATHGLPGIASSGVTARMNVRGGEEDETLMRLDGMRMYDPFHFRDFENLFSSIDPGIVEGMEVRTGGYPAAYGDRMSGVVDMRSLEPDDERVNELRVSALNSAFQSSGRFGDGRGEWVASLRRSNLDLIINAASPEIGEPEYFDLFGKVGYTIGEDWNVSGELLAIDDEIGLHDGDEVNESANYSDGYYWARFDNTPGDRFEGHYIVSQTRLRESHGGFIDDEVRAVGTLDESRDISITALAADWLYRWSDRRLVKWGAELREGDADYLHDAHAVFPNPIEFEGVVRTGVDASFDKDVQGQQRALYASHVARWGRYVTTELGLRWDDQSYTNDEQWSPRVNLLIDVGPRTQLRAAAGRYYQSQGLEELQINDGVSEFFPAQEAEHLVIGLEHRFDNALRVQIEAYEKEFERLRPRFENLYTRLDLLPELQPDRIRLDPRSGESSGVEVTVEQDLQPWQWWFNVAWSSVEDQLDGRDVPRSWDQPWSVGGGMIRSGERWTIAVAASWHEGWPSTSLALEDGRLVAGPLNAGRVGSFQSIDVRVSRKIELPRSTLTVFGELINALDHPNPCCLAYDLSGEPGEEPELELDTENWLPLLPSVGVAWRF
jgi:outer membrane receptor protein involved in Fe transport